MKNLVEKESGAKFWQENSVALWENHKFILPFLITVLVCIAWMNRFVQDDAFISFRYAENFANGYGLVWNPGERIEGYTNFLWTITIGFLMSLGVEPVISSFILGIVLFSISLIFCYKIARAVFENQIISLLSVVLLGTNYSFSSYATGGLETQLQTCLFLIAIDRAICCVKKRSLQLSNVLILSMASALAMLTRLDSAVLLSTIFVVVSLSILQKVSLVRTKIVYFLALCIPFATLVGGWLIWKQFYYGDILPNTFYTKVSVGTSLYVGIEYVSKMLISYWLVPFPFLLIFSSQQLFKTIENNSIRVLLVFPVVLWLAYIIKVGGDFMEFRFLVPILPLCFILIAWTIADAVKNKNIQLALISLIIFGSLQHWKSFGVFVKTGGIEPIARLQGHLSLQHENWEDIGKVLQEKLPENSDVTIAVTPAGAIPYYSGLASIDMHGLNDRWIAKNGKFLSSRPGHQKGATFDYLMSRQANLIIAHPHMVRNEDFQPNAFTLKEINSAYFFGTIEEKSSFPDTAKMVKIPVDREFSLIAVYLIDNPAIEEQIARGDWKVFPILKS